MERVTPSPGESQDNNQSEAPGNADRLYGEQWDKLKSRVMERARSYIKTSKRIYEQKDSRTGKDDPRQLKLASEFLAMRALGMGEALAILEGREKELSDGMEKAERAIPDNIQKIVRQFSNENP
jgi:hypothetical protein